MGPEKTTLDALRIDRSKGRGEPNRSWIWLVVLFCLGLAGALWWFLRPQISEVQTITVRARAVGSQTTSLNASGYVVARREATVSSKVTGKVTEVLIEEGREVEQGQILARLDSSNVKASLELAVAQLASAKSALAETKVRLHAADLDLRRVSGLATNRVASESDLDRATAEANSLRARLDQQQAEIEVAERQVALWAQQMDDTLIRAPFKGMVVSKNAQPGEMISPISAGGGFTRTGIGTIVDMDSLEIEVDVSESYINRVQPGQQVLAVLDAYPDWKIPGKVLAIIPTADRQKATVKVRVTFDKLDPRILPQMGVKVAFQAKPELASSGAGVVVPKTAIHQENGADVVYLLQNDLVERRAIKLGPASGDEFVVTAGLATGDKVIVQSSSELKEGHRVREKRQ